MWLTTYFAGRCSMAISEETRRKLSDAHRGRRFSDEHKARIGAANTGKVRSEETKEHLRQVNLGKKHSLESRELMSRSQRGRKHSEETKAKIARAHLGMKPSDETRAKLSISHSGDRAGNWNGGVVHSHGRVLLKSPDHPHADRGYVFRYRLVMEGQLGRYLLPSEVVHHIDGDPSNDNVENLQLFPDRASHTAHHKALERNREEAPCQT